MEFWQLLSGIASSDLSGWALLIGFIVFIVLALFRRWLVPGTTHREIVSFERVRGDEYKAASEKKDTTIASQAGALSAFEHFFHEVPVEERTMPKKARAGTADAPV